MAIKEMLIKKHHKINMPVLNMEGISKTFSGVKVLNNVRIELYPGEVHALMGENGAGKSTFMKILAGIHTPDQDGGTIYF
ncbi:ATP-binding cassette domain-containing protein, partial [Metabacillus sediminilitoris]